MGKAKLNLSSAAGIVAVLCVAGSVTMAQKASAAPLTVWQGGAELLSQTSQCVAGVPGFNVGDLAVSVFRPRLASTQPKSALTMLFHRSALSFFNNTGPDQMTGNGTYTGSWISARATGVPGGTSGTYSFTITPSGTITASTPGLGIVGTITNFAGVSGCTITFAGAYAKRPN